MLASLRIACALLGEDKRCLEGGEGEDEGREKSGEKWRGREKEICREEGRWESEGKKTEEGREGKEERGNGITIRFSG